MNTSTAKTPRYIALYPAETSLGWRVVKHVPFRQGLEKEATGAWRRVLNQSGDLIGFQLISTKVERCDRDLPTIHSSVTITAKEMSLNVERSHTAGLNEEQRMERIAAGRPPEDAVERVQCKIAVYVKVGSAKKDILRVWPREFALPPR